MLVENSNLSLKKNSPTKSHFGGAILEKKNFILLPSSHPQALQRSSFSLYRLL